jgi:hypothetical protein
VQVCAQNPRRLAGERWTLALWRRGKEQDQTRLAYTCGSYRCPSPECQRAAAHRDYAKIAEGIERAGRDGWVFLVLTLDRHGTETGKPWANEQDAFRALSTMSRNFLARLRRMHKRRGWSDPGSNWVGTVEVHGSGWPHYNLIVRSPGLARHLRRQSERLERAGAPEAVRTRLRGELKAAALGSGWGPVGYAAPGAGTPERLAGYLVKVGARMERQTGEITKLCQAPTNARMKLRRIRAGKGFLRAVERNPEWTGIMLRRRIMAGAAELDERGQVVRRGRPRAEVSTLMQPDQVAQAPELIPGYCEGARIAMAAELEQAKAELEHPERGERLRVESHNAPHPIARVPAAIGAELVIPIQLTRIVSRETLGAARNTGQKGKPSGISEREDRRANRGDAGSHRPNPDQTREPPGDQGRRGAVVLPFRGREVPGVGRDRDP